MNEQIEALKTAHEYINNLKDGINEIVKSIEDEQEQEGCKLILLLSDGIEWVMQVVKLTTEFHKDKISIGDLEIKLEDVVKAFENEDYTLISDLLMYEILPILEDVQNEISIII